MNENNKYLGAQIFEYMDLNEDMGSALGFIQELFDVTDILDDLTEGLQTALGQVMDIFNGLVVTPISNAIQGVKDWFNNLLGFRSETAQDLQDVVEQTADIETRVIQIQEIFDVVSTRSLADGLDPTGESTFRYEQLQIQNIPQVETKSTGGHTHTLATHPVGRPFLTLTQSITIFGWVRQGLTLEKSQATWIADKSGTINYFNVHIHTMASDGTVTRHFSSPDLSGQLLTNVPTWMQVKFPGITPEMGDIIGAEFAMGGSGSVRIAGIELLAPLALPGFRPAQIGALKPDGNTLASYSDAQMVSWATGLTPYVQFGSDVGQIGAKRSFVDTFDRAAIGPNWILRTSDAAKLKISSNRVVHDGHQLIPVYADAQWIQQLSTDAQIVEFTVTALTTLAPSNLVLCSNSAFNRQVILCIREDQVWIYTMKGARDRGDWVQRAHSTTTTAKSGTWRFKYDPLDNTYRGFRNNIQILAWTDTSNVVEHGEGYRYVGFGIDHQGFNDGGIVDNWKAWDV